MERSVLRSGLVLAATAMMAGACTSLLGDFDIDPTGTGTGGGSSSVSASGGGSSGGGGTGGSGTGGMEPCTPSVCPTGQEDCGCTGTCIDLTSEPAHCGACGTSCGEYDCVDGVCDALALATEQGQLEGIAVDATHVYWVVEGDGSQLNGSIWRVAKTGGDPQRLAEAQAAPLYLTVHDGFVYWTNRNDGTVKQSPVTGGRVTDVSTDNVVASGITNDGSFLYWANQGQNAMNGKVRRLPFDGAVQDVAAVTGEPFQVAVDSTHVYWTDRAAGVLSRALLAGSIGEPVIPGLVNPRSVASAGGFVFCTEQGGTHRIMRYSPADGAVLEVGSSATPYDIAADATHVYWTDVSYNDVFRVPINGGSRETFANGDSTPAGIALDNDFVYWVQGEAIMKKPK